MINQINMIVCTIYFESRSEYSKFSNIDLLYYASHQILLVMKSRRMKWVGNVADTREKRNTYRICQKPEGKRPL
jgi:hypothetical protein